MKAIKFLFLIGVLTLSTIEPLWAADPSVPPLVNYQGLLTDDNGAPIPDGMKTLEFNLYDAPLVGNKVWGPQVFDNVPIVNGRFNIILGTTDQLGRSISDAFGAGDRYLGFKIGNVGQDFAKDNVAEISPRQQILAAPFALRAFHGVPTGSIMAYFGKTAPDGWLLCDGRALTDASLQDKKYDALKAHLTSLGVSTIPDLRGRVVVGPDEMGPGAANRITKADGRNIGQVGGLELHVLTVPEMPSHTHGYRDIFFSEAWGSVPVPGNAGSGRSDSDNRGYEMPPQTTGPAGGGIGHNNMPPYMVVTYIIKL